MLRKKVESKDVTPKKGVAELSFFACQDLIHEMQVLAEKNDGELSDKQVQALVEAQTQAPAKLGKLCNFVKLMESHVKICKDRKKEINETQKRAERTLDRMCAYFATWVEAQGKNYHVGEYELKTRKSSSVKLVEGYNDPMFCKTETVTVITPDKKVIKEALVARKEALLANDLARAAGKVVVEAVEEVPGAELIEKLNLSIR